MDESFKHWRNSSKRLENTDESFVISDSEIENSIKVDGIIIDESDEDISENTTPKKNKSFGDDDDTPIVSLAKGRRLKKYRITDSDDSTNDDDDNDDDDSSKDYPTRTIIDIHKMFDYSDSDENSLPDKSYDSFSHSSLKNKGKKRKDVSHDNTKEDIKELKLNSSSESFSAVEKIVNKYLKNNTDEKTIDGDRSVVEVSHDEPVTIEFDSEFSSGRNSPTSEFATSIGREESSSGRNSPASEFATSIGREATNLDSIEQERALTIYKLEKLTDEVAKSKLLLTKGNIEVLPDRGKKLLENIHEQEKEIEKLINKLQETAFQKHNFNEEETEMMDESEYSSSHSDFRDDLSLDMKFDIFESMELGKKAQETRDKELALTVERLQDLHKSLVARPSEDEQAEDPRGLKVPLMPHQRHALAWLLWREQKEPSGGILADDMGLGKTLSMISLIMTTLTKQNSDDEDEKDEDSDEWSSERKPSYCRGGTLIVCPASLLSQWENEVQSKCKRGLLSVQVYHGNKRESVPKRLARNDIVITTYSLLPREYRSNSTLYKIKWKRVILDEAHIIRNHKSQASVAACELMATKRWALTGTPIQNKELDLYSILRFLRCSPFDDIRVWKRWVENKSAAGHQRLATVTKTLMLRRTKQELMAKGDLESLPNKSIEEVNVKLDPEEQLVYEKILFYSRTLFAQFLTQKAEKNHMFDLNSGRYNRPSFLSNPNKETRFTEAQKKLLARHADVKTHEILVLLLRLRQVCCHPALIHAMLDQEDVQQSEIAGMGNIDPELLSRVHRMSLRAMNSMDEEDIDEDIDEEDIDRRIIGNLLTIDNPVFSDDRTSSKMRVLLDTVKEILEKSDDKLIIVSQWTSLLDVVASRLSSIEGATFSKFTGKVAIKDRQSVVDSFNDQNSESRILLLSLTAGGVGLNLVGGNHLLLFDIHWNPQLESQAQDRIYRFGQTKDVYVYKFICTDTIEERIKALQERKLEIAKNILTGDKHTATKLTLNDLKSLFGF